LETPSKAGGHVTFTYEQFIPGTEYRNYFAPSVL
jgi:hypothetical protein